MKNISPPVPCLVWDLSKVNLAKKVFWFFFGLDLLLVILDLTINYARPINFIPLRRLRNIAREDGIGTYIGSFQTLCAGFTLSIIWLHSKLKHENVSSIRGWGFLSVFFCYMALDDVSGLHERIGAAVREILQSSTGESSAPPKFPSYTWQICFGPFLAFILIYMIRHFNREITNIWQRNFLLCAIICYVSAVFFDFLEGLDGFFPIVAGRLAVKTYAVSHFSKVAEEFLELLGGTFFLTAFSGYLQSKADAIKIKFS